jgi:hypothetical protein
MLPQVNPTAKRRWPVAKKQNKAREDRIIMEIVVDAYCPEERAMKSKSPAWPILMTVCTRFS